MTTACPTTTATPHIPGASPDAEKLEWVPWDGSPFRSIEASCVHCSPVLYEWGMLGGAYRIRRTQNGKVRLTPTVPRQRALQWWELLRSGRAV